MNNEFKLQITNGSKGKTMSGSSHPSSAGNGSLMRLASIPMFYAPNKVKARTYASKSSRTTYAAKECVDAWVLFAEMLGNSSGRRRYAGHIIGIRVSRFPGWIYFICVMKLLNWQKS